MQQAPEGIPEPAHMQKKPPNNRRALFIGGIVLALLLVLSGAIGLWNSNPGLQRAFEPSCTVRVTGATTTVTLQGWRAPQGCNFFAATGPVNGVRFYASPQTPTNPIVCVGPWKGVYLTVRDQSNNTFTDDEICGKLLHVTPTSGN